MNENAGRHERRLDLWSGIVIVLTFVLFGASLAVHGLTHDMFLEAGVLLVSIKLILSSHRTDAHIERLNARIGEALARRDGPRSAHTPVTPRG